jgi:RNA polymerase sigma-70 factor, ECF subfamily
MLGSLTEADYAVQDPWMRVSPADASEVENLGGWLTTIVALVLNLLRARTPDMRKLLQTTCRIA